MYKQSVYSHFTHRREYTSIVCIGILHTGIECVFTFHTQKDRINKYSVY